MQYLILTSLRNLRESWYYGDGFQEKQQIPSTYRGERVKTTAKKSKGLRKGEGETGDRRRRNSKHFRVKPEYQRDRNISGHTVRFASGMIIPIYDYYVYILHNLTFWKLNFECGRKYLGLNVIHMLGIIIRSLSYRSFLQI